jgi:hypothetical protein
MNTFTKLKLHLEAHMYKRGKHKGEAPADSSRRGKSFFRVKANGDTMVVRMHNTNIITAYEDGTIEVSCGGWWTNTTRMNLNAALSRFGARLYVSGRKVFGMSQPTITRSGGPTWLFYDGIKFDAENELLSTPLCFECKRKDRTETAEFRADIAESGFKGVFPVLYQSAEVPSQTWMRYSLHKVMRDDAHAGEWPTLIALAKYPTYRSRALNRPAHADWREAWKALYASATTHMTEVIRTDVTYLPYLP